MRISRLMGRKLPVDLSLIKDLSVDVKESEESVDLMVVGSIMESAKIFEKLVVRDAMVKSSSPSLPHSRSESRWRARLSRCSQACCPTRSL